MGCRVVHSGNTEPTWEGAMAMETMTRVNEQMDVAAKKAKDQRQAVRERMWDEDSPSYKPTAVAAPVVAEEEPREFSLRGAIGHVLRELRTRDRRTLREVSEKAGVSLGYLSEVERGQKEASSELLSSIADALGVSTSRMLRMVADYLDSVEG